jgi:hypothetical protein
MFFYALKKITSFPKIKSAGANAIFRDEAGIEVVMTRNTRHITQNNN